MFKVKNISFVCAPVFLCVCVRILLIMILPCFKLMYFYTMRSTLCDCSFSIYCMFVLFLFAVRLVLLFFN